MPIRADGFFRKNVTLPMLFCLQTAQNCGIMDISIHFGRKELYHLKISTKGRYALRMLIELGCHSGDSYVSLKEVSENQNISKKYLEQIVPLLSKSGILRTTRGNHGGYILAKPASEITVADVLRATEGSLAPVSCLEQPVNDCPRADICPTLELWQGLMRTVEDYLERYSVQDLVDRKLNLGGDDYSI